MLPQASAEVPPWLRGKGEMALRIREYDWGRTSLGPIHAWPKSLCTTVGTLLHARHPMFLWWGPDLIQIYNDAYLPSFGVGKHPAALGQRGRDCWQEIWPIIGPQIEGVLLRGEATWHEDALIPILRNGRLEDVWWTYGYSPVFDESGGVGGVLVVCTETTARVMASEGEKQALRQLELEKARLHRFLEQAPAAICILRGQDLVFELANSQYTKLVSRSELVGKPLLAALPELAGQGFDDLLRGVMSTGETFVGREVRVALATAGEPESLAELYCTFIYSPLRDAVGRTEGVAAFVLDVTDQVRDRRKAEDLAAKLQRSDEEFRTLAESIPHLAWSARADGWIDWYNRRWYEFTGTTFGDMEGWGWRSVHDPAMVAEVESRWQSALTQGIAFEMEFPLRRGDGVYRWHLTRAVPLRDANGQILRWFGTNTDVDDARRAQAERSQLLATAETERERAEAANRSKDEFLATASHELRTPLNAILGWARLLRGSTDPTFHSRGVEIIERNAVAQIRLIEDILDGSRIITGKLHLEMQRVDFSQLVRMTVEATRPVAEAKGQRLTLRVDSPNQFLLGDAERLQQVVSNLVNNSIKFTPRGGSIQVQLGHSELEHQLSVLDDGQGIDADFLPHVFDRFRQGDTSTTRRHSGLGLGLALVRHLVEAHGGSVSAASAGPGLGSTFTVRLPREAANSLVTPTSEQGLVDKSRHSDANLHGIRLLVVDDDADARELIATVLQRHGATVALAANAEDALHLMARERPHILLSDVGMPETDGYALMRKLREELGMAEDCLPAIALTAYTREVDRRLALEAGFQAHLAKPVEPTELLHVVTRMLGVTR